MYLLARLVEFAVIDKSNSNYHCKIFYCAGRKQYIAQSKYRLTPPKGSNVLVYFALPSVPKKERGKKVLQLCQKVAKVYKCGHCIQTFYRKETLVHHLQIMEKKIGKTTSGGEPSYQCQFCSVPFSEKSTCQ